MPQLSENLTQEDITYLLMKWGRLYTQNEWILLEKDYNDMMNSFDIHDADTKSTLLLICKTNLKMNQAIDSGDIETYQKLSKVSNDLRKSARFTAAQKKEKDQDDFDSIGVLVSYCEKSGPIPRYDVCENPDLVDTLITNIKNYSRSLVYSDSNLSQQIERYLALLEASLKNKEAKNNIKEKKRAGDLKPEELLAYAEMQEKQLEESKKALKGDE